jgi:hypothetical protein
MERLARSEKKASTLSFWTKLLEYDRKESLDKRIILKWALNNLQRISFST